MIDFCKKHQEDRGTCNGLYVTCRLTCCVRNVVFTEGRLYILERRDRSKSILILRSNGRTRNNGTKVDFLNPILKLAAYTTCGLHLACFLPLSKASKQSFAQAGPLAAGGLTVLAKGLLLIALLLCTAATV